MTLYLTQKSRCRFHSDLIMLHGMWFTFRRGGVMRRYTPYSRLLCKLDASTRHLMISHNFTAGDNEELLLGSSIQVQTSNERKVIANPSGRMSNEQRAYIIQLCIIILQWLSIHTLGKKRVQRPTSISTRSTPHTCGVAYEMDEGSCGAAYELGEGSCGVAYEMDEGSCGAAYELGEGSCGAAYEMDEGTCGTAYGTDGGTCGLACE